MSCTVLILRPQPGADATAGRAKELGLEPSIYSLFATEPLAWTAPDPAGFDAVLLTSANTLRHGGI
ncbi:MAG: uroporphyrinogen-III synthase, partial [Sphingobium sp.]